MLGEHESFDYAQMKAYIGRVNKQTGFKKVSDMHTKLFSALALLKH